MRRLLTACCVGGLVALAPAVQAQVDARALLDAMAAAGHERGPLQRSHVQASGATLLLVEPRASVPTSTTGVVPLSPSFGVFAGSVSQLRALSVAHPDWAVHWAPPRRLLLDRARPGVQLPRARRDYGVTGRGVLVGIVDSGIDLAHPDLRRDDGTTRVRWLLDLSRPPAGRHPELEAALGCSDQVFCAVFAAEDIDELLNDERPGDLPRDTLGHGTHVASIAAGDGSAVSDGAYAGLAPEAELVVVRATRSGAPIVLDPDVVLATSFVFERAASLGLPAVVNLSLGSDFGAHDGSSELERALGEFVGPEWPGRAIVVSAGNSGTLELGVTSAYPEPFGVHTEVHVSTDSSVRVPLLTLPGSGATVDGSVDVWVSARPGDRLAVGLEDARGTLVGLVPPGGSRQSLDGELTTTVINGVTGEGSVATGGSNGAAVSIEGTWPSGATFALRFEGRGSARLWLQTTGGVSALFPRARKAGTITVPASSPELIAVGATQNRAGWTDYAGETVEVESEFLPPAVPGAAAYFSSAGPNALGAIKPDLVAPGAWVAAALAEAADPRGASGGRSMFASPLFCDSPERACWVVDDAHAVGAGTSMAAPLVAGAVALLLERDPQLTQPEVLALLQAGARRPEPASPEPQLGAGVLDVAAVLDAEQLRRRPVERRVAATASALVLADTLARPDPEWPLQMLLQLRSEDGQLADLEPSRIEVQTNLAQAAVHWARRAPGLYGVAAAAPGDSGGQILTVTVRVDGQTLLRREVPIAVDPWVASHGYSARGGCAVGSRVSATLPSAWGWALVAGAVALGRRRLRAGPDTRCSPRARRGRCLDRRDAPGRHPPSWCRRR